MPYKFGHIIFFLNINAGYRIINKNLIFLSPVFIKLKNITVLILVIDFAKIIKKFIIFTNDSYSTLIRFI